MGRLDPEVAVEILDGGEWRPGFAYSRQQSDDGWWYPVRHGVGERVVGEPLFEESAARSPYGG
jgi:hypothetical protein